MSKGTIVVVDDVSLARKRVQNILEPMGYVVISIGDAEEALNYLIGYAEQVDLLITDIAMPKISGLELIGKIREKPSLNKITILVLTGDESEETANGVSLQGAGYMLKPFDDHILLQRVEELFAKRKVNILVADDSSTYRKAMFRFLASVGFMVDLAEDGMQAWEMFQQKKYDLLLTDLEMPNMDGFGLIGKVRSHEENSKIPIIIFTTHRSTSDVLKAKKYRVSEFLGKPFSEDVVLYRVNKLLAESK